MPNSFSIKLCLVIVLASMPFFLSAQLDVQAPLINIEKLDYAHDLDLQLPLSKSVLDSQIESFENVTSFDHSLVNDSWDHWLRLTCTNTSEEDQAFVFDFKNWTKVAIQEMHLGSQEIYRTGHHVPFKDRNYPTSNEALITLDFKGGESKDLLIHLESTIDYLQVPATVRFNVFGGKKYLTKRLAKRLLFGMFCGFYIIMFLHNLFIYSSTKDRNYLPYLVALIGVLILTIHNFGFFVPMFKDWPGYVFFHSKMQFFGSMILGWSMLVFTDWFLEVKKRYPKFHKVLRLLMVLIIFLPLPSLFGYASINEKISGLMGITTMIFILTVAIKSKMDGYPSSGYFLIGYGGFSIGIIVMLSSFLGILPTTVQDVYPVNIGSTIEMVFFSLALGNRINLLQKDNEEKQEQIIGQLKDKEEMQSRLNRELEEKVVIRTQEIQQQKVELEEQKVELEKEKDKADALLLNILPAPVARELQAKGSATPRYYDEVTVLFADIVGFTQKSAGLRPERIINELDYCFKGFDEILEKYGVEKIKTIGDGYMCVGGIPIPSEDSAIQTARAALEMQSFMRKWSAEKAEWNEEPWSIRIGLHTGEVVAGIVGKRKFAYDVWGQSVNTASRIENASDPGKVNISEDTFKLIQDHFETERRGKIKTKEREIEMYYVLCEK